VQFLVDILLLGSRDSHIFADPDPDPGSQNLADPTDPDTKHFLVRYFPKGRFPRKNFQRVFTQMKTSQVCPSHGAWHPRLF